MARAATRCAQSGPSVRCGPWRAERGPVAPGRRRRELLPKWRRGDRPEAGVGDMQSACETPSSHSLRCVGKPAPPRCGDRVAKPLPGAGRTGATKAVAMPRVLAAAGAPARYHEGQRNSPGGGPGPFVPHVICPVPCSHIAARLPPEVAPHRRACARQRLRRSCPPPASGLPSSPSRHLISKELQRLPGSIVIPAQMPRSCVHERKIWRLRGA
jgi:hypothetical protein